MDRVTKCSSLTKCFDRITQIYDNSKCPPGESCGKAGTFDETGCIGKKYCGTNEIYLTYGKLNYICPMRSEKEGLANASSMIPRTLS